MKHSRMLIAVALPVLALVTLAGCVDDKGKIPFNKEKAREHIIKIEQADKFKNDFVNGRDSLATILANDSSQYLEFFKLPNAEMFNRDAIIALLDAEGAAGIRIYLGRDVADSGKVKLVMLPVNKDGKDIRTNLLHGKQSLTRKAGAQAGDGDGDGDLDDGGQAVEVGQRCPTICD